MHCIRKLGVAPRRHARDSRIVERVQCASVTMTEVEEARGRGSRIGEAEGESGRQGGRKGDGEYNDAARMNMHDKRDRVSLERD